MKRHVRILLGCKVLVLLALLTFAASSAFAKTGRCMVINDRINTTYMIRRPDSMNPVQDAIDEASPGDTLWIRGYCPGPVKITKSLTLEGQEIAGFAYAPTIDASGVNVSVVEVSGSSVQVQINSLILAGGGSFRGPASHGGGIWNVLAELILNNVTITSNWAVDGGGIYNDSGTVELYDSAIYANVAREGLGGGIYTKYGTVILDSSTITHNIRARKGGGICAFSSIVVANKSEIANNWPSVGEVPRWGGGIHMDWEDGPSNTLVLIDTTIHDNYASEGGGGIHAEHADVTIAGSSELSWNRAYRMGGGAQVNGNLVLSGDTKIHHNTAASTPGTPPLGAGGGVAFSPGCSGCKFTMSGNATIYDNDALLEGGGIHANDADLVGCFAGTEGDEGVNVFNNLPDNIHP